jgi:hypothetical protein
MRLKPSLAATEPRRVPKSATRKAATGWRRTERRRDERASKVNWLRAFGG